MEVLAAESALTVVAELSAEAKGPGGTSELLQLRAFYALYANYMRAYMPTGIHTYMCMHLYVRADTRIHRHMHRRAATPSC